MISSDTPTTLALEIYGFVFGPSLLMALATATLFAWLQTWRPSPFNGAGRFVAGATVVALGIVLVWASFVLMFGSALEHPRYRAHVICDPCF